MDSFDLDFFQISDTGKVRELNEDCCDSFVSKDGQVHFFIVADGMGGHLAGEVASNMTVSLFGESVSDFEYKDEKSLELFLYATVDSINEAIKTRASASQNCSNMGTTAVIYAATPDCGLFCNVGDSRGYMISDDKMNQVTKDHSLVQSMIDNGYLFGEDTQKNYFSNVITKALGFLEKKYPDSECDIFRVVPNDGDTVLLCSDGLTNMLSDQEICEILISSENVECGAKKLIERAKDQGGLDNITVSVIKYNAVTTEENGGETV